LAGATTTGVLYFVSTTTSSCDALEAHPAERIATAARGASEANIVMRFIERVFIEVSFVGRVVNA